MLTGYILAIVASLLYTLYIVPKKLSKQTPVYYMMFMGMGFSVSSVIVYIIYKLINSSTTETLSSPVLLWSALRRSFVDARGSNVFSRC